MTSLPTKSAPHLAPKLAIALDVEDRARCLETAYLFQGLPVVLKLGLGLLPLLEPKDIRSLRDEGFDLFIDAKLHDIPSQVGRAVNAWAGFGAKYLTVHAAGGPRMLREAARASSDTGMRVLAVTVLTSLAASDLGAIGVPAVVEDHVARLVRMSVENEVRSFVCSVGEIQAVRDNAGAGSFVTTPGLVLEAGQSHSDQARVHTVSEAVQRGADLLVVGRSILQSPEPRVAAELALRVMGARA